MESKTKKSKRLRDEEGQEQEIERWRAKEQ
jgi:hypothetical protein